MTSSPFIPVGSSGNVGPFGQPSPQKIAPSAVGSGTTLGAIGIEIAAIFAATVLAGTSDSTATLMLWIIGTLWVLRLIHYVST